ncbi:MAG: phosphoglucosamine mutase [Acidimicrobiales bacterium]|jgi:phosphoglucosamine mutase
MAVQFGTDGIRGRASDEITNDLAYRLGRAVASVFTTDVFVGYDTRESSPHLARAVLLGLRDGGAHGVNLGYFTTPGVAVIAQQRGGAGVVVSASHNPYYDNGLKVLGVGGGKLDYATELAVAEALHVAASPENNDFEEFEIDESAEHDYAHHLRSLVPADFSSLHIVLDCANGAASHVAHEIFESTGARITTIHDEPNGRNINVDSGSTHVDALKALVLELHADLGLAFDGDADRLIAVDAGGQVRDGDDLMILFARDFFERNVLGGGLVVTSMSNLGLHRSMADAGIAVVETDVGDRNVLIELEDRAWPFGGEQSGHLIFRSLAPTGDGQLTGLMLADLIVRRGPLAEQADAVWHRVPQRLINVDRDHYDDDVARAIFEEIRTKYGIEVDDVRLLIRPSGTEPVVRVMIEALDEAFVNEFSQRIQNFFLT